MKISLVKTSVILFSSLICAQLSINTPAYADKLYPVDEGVQDPSFSNFREQLKAAIKRRDTKFILNRIAPDIAVGFGTCSAGVKCFQEKWQLNKPNSDFWQTLDELINLGGSFDNTRGRKVFCAPYVSSKFPSIVNGEKIQGVPEYSVILGNDVNVRSRPSLNAPVVAQLSYDIVGISFEPSDFNKNWVKITTPKPGYVARKFIRHPNDYSAYFEIIKGKWVMIVLTAGD